MAAEKRKNSTFTETDLSSAVKSLEKGEIILYPTDTVWGLGCDATSASAVSEIFRIKKRKESKSLIVLVADKNQLLNYVSAVSEEILQLMGNSERPLTVIFEQARELAAGIAAPDGSVGIRLVKDEFCRSMIQKLGRPVVSTSANISGDPAPAIFSEIPEAIIRQANYVVKWRQADSRKEYLPGSLKWIVTEKLKFYVSDFTNQRARTSFTISAASCNSTAEKTFNPESASNFLASTAFVPCKRTIMGTFILAIFL